MGKVISFGFVFLLFMTISLASAEEQPVGFFKTVGGIVKVMRAEEKIDVMPGMKFHTGDIVITEALSNAGIVFHDGTVLTLGAATELKIKKYVFQPEEKKYDFSLIMKRGEMIYNSGKLSKMAPEKVNLETPRATVGVRGTRFILAVK